MPARPTPKLLAILFILLMSERSDIYIKPIKGFNKIIRAITVAKTKEMFKKIITAHTKTNEWSSC